MNKVQAAELFNIRTIQRDYISKALSEQQGHKYLVLDEFTMDCITVAFFRSELFEFNVFDTMLIKNTEGLTTQGSTTGVFVIRPNDDNVQTITSLLANPPFEQIYICRPPLTRLHQPSNEPDPGIFGKRG